MPKMHDLKANGANRDSLLRYALTARLTEIKPEGRQRRGAPTLPNDAATQFSDRRLSAVLFNATPSEEELDRLIETIERVPGLVQSDAERSRRRLRSLAVTFNAIGEPQRVARGVVDARFWVSLRRLGFWRHPVDLVVAGYCAVNYLLPAATRQAEVELAPKDQRAVERLMAGLSVVALGGYPFSSDAVDLLAVFSWWSPDTLVRAMDQPSGRRLARTLDRAARANLPIPAQTEIGGGEAQSLVDEKTHAPFFAALVRGAITAMDNRHTATSSSSAAFRLARLVLVWHYEPLARANQEGLPPCGALVKALCRVATGQDGTTDALLRREAAWYLAEAKPLIERLAAAFDDPTIRECSLGITERLARDNPPLFGDIHAMAQVLDDNREVAWHESTTNVWRRNFDDFTGDEKISVTLWEERARHAFDNIRHQDDVDWWKAIQDHLRLDTVPRTRTWRRLTKQISVPTVALLYEFLFTPWSARARWIVDTFRAAGADVINAVTETLENMLRDENTIQSQVAAKRAAWCLGYLAPRPSVLRVLCEVAQTQQAPSDVIADAIWAMGDVLVVEKDTAEEVSNQDHADAEAVLLEFLDVKSAQDQLDRIQEDLTTAQEIPANPDSGTTRVSFSGGGLSAPSAGWCIPTQAALHSLAIQLNEKYVDQVGRTLVALREIEHKAEAIAGMAGISDPEAWGHFIDHVSDTYAMADWAVRKLDAEGLAHP